MNVAKLYQEHPVGHGAKPPEGHHKMFKRIFAISTLIICAPGAVAQHGPGSALQRIDRNGLCVTNGTVSALPGGAG